jgi:hypothetical protein
VQLGGALNRERIVASIECPFCGNQFGCRHLIGEGDDQIIWQWDAIADLKRLCEEADLMRIDIGALAKGIRGFEDLTLATQSWYGDYVPDVIVDAPGIHLVADRCDFGGPANGTFYCVFVDPKQRRRIEREYDVLVERLQAATAPRGTVS